MVFNDAYADGGIFCAAAVAAVAEVHFLCLFFTSFYFHFNE
jgi:hypothetical protein